MNKKTKLTKENMAGMALYAICLISILLFIANSLK